MESNLEISKLIDSLITKLDSWIVINRDKTLSLIDPIDNKEINYHYGASHLSCAFIILGKKRGDKKLVEKGKKILENVLNVWDSCKNNKSFHFDFNNFALSIISDYIKNDKDDLYEKIKKTVLSTSDSKHYTVNWLPMRYWVNCKRYSWTKNNIYKSKSDYLLNYIKRATNSDGGIEDLLPKGKSYNLQYNISTVSTLQFINIKMKNFDLTKEINYLLNKVLPDGDINYQGRGVNQIFAWGPWIYILSSSNKINELEIALKFIKKKLFTMLENNNIMLNEWKGHEKFLWWDYHFSSVYISHFLFWLTISSEDYNKTRLSKTNVNGFYETGLNLFKEKNYCLASFNGRSEYYSEFGPSINALWLKKYGIIFKGGGGPYMGNFGNKYTFTDLVNRIHFGLIEVSNQKKTNNKVLNKFINIDIKNYLKPLFTTHKISSFDNKGIKIEFENPLKKEVILNIPSSITKCMYEHISLEVDNKEVKLFENLKIRSQYGWFNIIQSNKQMGKSWKLVIF